MSRSGWAILYLLVLLPVKRGLNPFKSKYSQGNSEYLARAKTVPLIREGEGGLIRERERGRGRGRERQTEKYREQAARHRKN